VSTLRLRAPRMAREVQTFFRRRPDGANTIPPPDGPAPGAGIKPDHPGAPRRFDGSPGSDYRDAAGADTASRDR
jgi:hypothetical protein